MSQSKVEIRHFCGETGGCAINSQAWVYLRTVYINHNKLGLTKDYKIAPALYLGNHEQCYCTVVSLLGWINHSFNLTLTLTLTLSLGERQQRQRKLSHQKGRKDEFHFTVTCTIRACKQGRMVKNLKANCFLFFAIMTIKHLENYNWLKSTLMVKVRRNSSLIVMDRV